MKQGSAHLIPSCKPATQFGKGCGCTTDAFSSSTSILIGCIDPRLLCRSGKSPPHEKIIEEIKRTLTANRMRDGVQIRLTLTRGVKITSGLDQRLNQSGPTLIVL